MDLMGYVAQLDVIDLIGYVATGSGMCIFSPEVFETIRTKKVGMKWATLVLLAVNTVSWGIVGNARGVTPLVVSQVILGLHVLILFRYKLRYG